MTTWFTSDTHAFHRNIVRGVTTWTHKEMCRDFDDEIQMTEKKWLI